MEQTHQTQSDEGEETSEYETAEEREENGETVMSDGDNTPLLTSEDCSGTDPEFEQEPPENSPISFGQPTQPKGDFDTLEEMNYVEEVTEKKIGEIEKEWRYGAILCFLHTFRTTTLIMQLGLMDLALQTKKEEKGKRGREKNGGLERDRTGIAAIAPMLIGGGRCLYSKLLVLLSSLMKRDVPLSSWSRVLRNLVSSHPFDISSDLLKGKKGDEVRGSIFGPIRYMALRTRVVLFHLLLEWQLDRESRFYCRDFGSVCDLMDLLRASPLVTDGSNRRFWALFLQNKDGEEIGHIMEEEIPYAPHRRLTPKPTAWRVVTAITIDGLTYFLDPYRGKQTHRKFIKTVESILLEPLLEKQRKAENAQKRNKRAAIDVENVISAPRVRRPPPRSSSSVYYEEDGGGDGDSDFELDDD